MPRATILTLTTMLLIGCTPGNGAETPVSASSSGSGTSNDGSWNGKRDENFQCIGSFSGRFTNVFVPEGRSCTLRDALVSGNILARQDAELHVDDTRVQGNIDGVEAAIVQVRGGVVGGSIQIQDGKSPDDLGAAVIGTILTQGNIQIKKMFTGEIRIEGAELRKGNIKIEENQVDTALDVLDNFVAQNIQVFKNAGAGVKSVMENRVRQILQCKENRSLFTGGPNRAAEAEDQCF
jgi:hypothetical protein